MRSRGITPGEHVLTLQARDALGRNDMPPGASRSESWARAVSSAGKAALVVGLAVGMGILLGSVLSNPLFAAGGAFVLSLATEPLVGAGYEVFWRGRVEGWILRRFVVWGI